MEGREFNFAVPLAQEYVVRSKTHATTGEEKKYLVLRGWASDAGEDQLDGQMTEECVINMVRTCNEKGLNAPVFRNVQAARNARPVMVDIEHSDNIMDQIGFAPVARALYAPDLPPEALAQGVTPPVMEVEVWVNLGMSHGRDIKESLDDGKQLGLSIFGKVRRAMKTRSPKTGRVIEQFQDVELTKIAITGAPANKNMWVREVRRSMKGVEMPEETIDDVVTDAPAPVDEPVADPPTAEAEEATVARSETAPGVEGTLEVSNEDTVAAPMPAAAAVVAVPEPSVAATPAATDTTLEPDALAELMQAGIIPAPAPAPAAVAAPEPAPAPVAPETVARTQPVETPDQWVSRSELTTYFTAVNDLLKPQTDELAEVKRSLADATDLITHQATRLTDQAAIISALTGRLEALENQGTGRRGMTVMRSLLDSGLTPTEQARTGLNDEERLAAMQALARAGRPEDAISLRMGWLKPNQIGVSIPELEAAEKRRKAQESGS